jgi:hypothetical protein
MSKDWLEKTRGLLARALPRSEEPEPFDESWAMAAGVATRSGIVAGQAVSDPPIGEGEGSEPIKVVYLPPPRLPKIIILT